jgi:hypothetical protein
LPTVQIIQKSYLLEYNRLKKHLLIIFIFFFQNQFGQELSLKIMSDSTTDQSSIDSLGFQKKHSNAKKVLAEVQKFSNQLLQLGYLEHEIVESKKINDTLYQFKFSLGVATKSIYIYTEKESTIFGMENDTIVIPINTTTSFLQKKLNELELKGFSLAKVQLIDFKKEKNKLFARLKIEANKKRILDEIVINGYEKFPNGHKKNIQRLYRKKIFNKSNLNKIYEDFNNFRFINQTRYPEILFSNDRTKIYVYLEKAKANRFDGYIGFANDENANLNFTGYLDLALANILNAGEEFNLYWRSDDNKQVTFNAGIEIPYIFKSPLALKANLNIFRQDSTFQNTKTSIDLGYYFTNTKKLFLGYQSTTSSDIQNTNSNFISDFNSKFATATFEYKKYAVDGLFPQKTNFILKNGFGQRTSKLEGIQQTFLELNLSHNLYLNKRNILNIRSQNFYLNSTNFITNELYRFGGIQSIRGFNENSLQANTFASLLTEYRFILASNIYVHSVLDYGFYEDRTYSRQNNLLGLGIGIGILSKNGVLNLIYANGRPTEQAIKLANSVLHIKFISTF